jgi:ATP-dependent protease HslVU (ClpYQ) peptidase subunit
MTTIAVRNGFMAADSQESDEGNSVKRPCKKIYEKQITYRGVKWRVLIGTAGATYTGMVFVDWYDGNPNKRIPYQFENVDYMEDFECLILHPAGVFTVNRMCRPILSETADAAVGSGSKAAMAVMMHDHKASAKRAVEVACKIDAYTALPVLVKSGPTRCKS